MGVVRGSPCMPILQASMCTMYKSEPYARSAGTKACLMSWEYGMLMYSTIRKAAAPMTGGMIWPLEPAATSTAPAFSAEKPTFFISMMVTGPQVSTLAMEDPEIRPCRPEATTAALAGPPRMWPSRAKDSEVR